jgi:hypothetical protein
MTAFHSDLIYSGLKKEYAHNSILALVAGSVLIWKFVFHL